MHCRKDVGSYADACATSSIKPILYPPAFVMPRKLLQHCVATAGVHSPKPRIHHPFEYV